MAKIKMAGESSRTVEYDIMIITVTFRAYEATIAAALEKIDKDCETFLKILSDNGFETNLIRMKEINTEQPEPDEEDDIKSSAKRSIEIRIPFSAAAANNIEWVIGQNDLGATLSVSFDVSDRDTIKKDLLREAFEDSKNKASLVADAMGQTITNIEEVLHSDKYRRYEDKLFEEADDEYYDIMNIFNGRPQSLADKLAASSTTVSESIDVIWIIE